MRVVARAKPLKNVDNPLARHALTTLVIRRAGRRIVARALDARAEMRDLAVETRCNPQELIRTELSMPAKQPKDKTLPLFSDRGPARGTMSNLPVNGAGFARFYEHAHGTLFVGDCVPWLEAQPAGSVDLIFADPPYNIKKAEWDSFESQEHYIEWSLRWLRPAARLLKPTGSLYVCGFSEILADLKHPASRLFNGCKWLVWHYKNKANLGNDWGRSHESILHFRKSELFRLNLDAVRIPYGNHTLKYPSHPQAETSQYGNGKGRDDWTPNPLGAKPRDVIEIPTTCNGMGEKTPHPTQKPEELLRRLILAASSAGDVVLDPFSGSGTTIVVAEQLGRRWLGCEARSDYNQWAVGRVESVPERSVAQWVEFDRANAMRREGIR